jgi:hypothetical protein
MISTKTTPLTGTVSLPVFVRWKDGLFSFGVQRKSLKHPEFREFPPLDVSTLYRNRYKIAKMFHGIC